MTRANSNQPGPQKTADRKVGRNVVPQVEDDSRREARKDQQREAEEIARNHPAGFTDKDLPERDQFGRLTRGAMEKCLAQGGSVLIHQRNANGDIVNGRMATHVDHLPSEADLSEGDTSAEDAALQAIEDRQRLLEADKEKILSRRGRGRSRGASTTATDNYAETQTHGAGGSATASATPLAATGPRQVPPQAPPIPNRPPPASRPPTGEAPLVPPVPTEGEQRE